MVAPSFINTEEAPQGAFDTAGWQMAAMVEMALGREIVIKSVCDPRELLVSYNRVAKASASGSGRSPTLWSETLLARLSPAPRVHQVRYHICLSRTAVGRRRREPSNKTEFSDPAGGSETTGGARGSGGAPLRPFPVCSD